MSILDQKRKVFGNIAALRTLTDGLPKLKTKSSFQSINNEGDVIAFLSDLIKSLIGYEALVRETVDTLVYDMKSIEVEIKKVLKSELKSIVSCGVNPSIPPFLKSNGTGIHITVPKVDFTNVLYTNPVSVAGRLLYEDVTPNLLDSTDFNTFLYETIQKNGTVESWGNTTRGSNILNVRFDASDITGVQPNNTLKITANANYDQKTLTDFNNDYVDSINLFNTETLLTNIIDVVFGSVSSFLKKSRSMLENDAKLNTVIDKMVNSTADVIEDKVFKFTKSELQKHEELADLRKNGQTLLDGSNKIVSTLPIDNLTTFNKDMSNALNIEGKKAVVAKSLDFMANASALGSPNSIDIPNIKLNFIQQIINNLIKAIVNIVLSPKVVMIFLINFKIIYGPNATFDNAIDFVKKNKVLMHNIMKRIAALIIKKLLAIAIKKITELVAETAIKEEIEKNKSNISQLLSLLGVPQETLRLIKGFT